MEHVALTSPETTGVSNIVVSKMPIEHLLEEVYQNAAPTAKGHILNQLVVQTYESAPPMLKKSLLEHLMRPLGVLSLVALGTGVFAKLRFRSTLPEMSIRLEDLDLVKSSDVLALLEHVQQVSNTVLVGLAHLVETVPTMASSGVVAVLMTLLLQSAKARRSEDVQKFTLSPIGMNRS